MHIQVLFLLFTLCSSHIHAVRHRQYFRSQLINTNRSQRILKNFASSDQNVKKVRTVKSKNSRKSSKQKSKKVRSETANPGVSPSQAPQSDSHTLMVAFPSPETAYAGVSPSQEAPQSDSYTLMVAFPSPDPTVLSQEPSIHPTNESSIRPTTTTILSNSPSIASSVHPIFDSSESPTYIPTEPLIGSKNPSSTPSAKHTDDPAVQNTLVPFSTRDCNFAERIDRIIGYTSNSVSFNPLQTQASTWISQYGNKCVSDSNLMQRYSLAVLYFSTKGKSWAESTNWLANDKDHCQWFGVECNEEGLVTRLNLCK